MNTPSSKKEAFALQEKIAAFTFPAASAENGEQAAPLCGLVVAERYELVELIGEGGMSCVYRALDKQLGHMVAIKLLLQSRKQDAAALARFQQEAVAVSRLEHPNIVRPIDFGVAEDGQPFLVMDLVDGRPLSRLLEEKKSFTMAQIFSLTKGTLDALVHAHAQGIVHRDIKPSNIMVTFDQNDRPTVHIVDFGIAKLTALQNGSMLTRTGDIFGSPHYMSPEQCLGNNVDGRSDLYSLGCIVYELLQGTPPYEAENILKVMHMHVSERPEPINRDDLTKKQCAALSKFCNRAMAIKVKDRFSDAGAMASAFSELIEDNFSDLCDSVAKPRKARSWFSGGLWWAQSSWYVALCLMLVPALVSLVTYLYLANSTKISVQPAMMPPPATGGVPANTSPPAGGETLPIFVNHVYVQPAENGQHINNMMQEIPDETFGILPTNHGYKNRYGQNLIDDRFLWSGMASNPLSTAEHRKLIRLALEEFDRRQVKDVSISNLLRTAKQFQISGDTLRSLTLYQAAANFTTLDEASLALAQIGVGDGYMDLGYVDTAMGFYKQASAVLDQLPEHRLDAALLLYKRAMCRAAEGDNAAAKRLSLNAIKNLEAIDATKKAGASSGSRRMLRLTTLADAYMFVGQPAKAIAVLQDADPQWRRCVTITAVDDAEALSRYLMRARLANAFFLNGDISLAIETAESLAASIDTTYAQERQMSTFGVYKSVMPRLTYLMACMYEAREMIKSTGEKRDFSTALRNLNTSLRLAGGNCYGFGLLQAMVWKHYATIYDEQGDRTKAQACRQQTEGLIADFLSFKSLRPTLLFED
jgi:serine/threonine protein kinase